jgi:hypothetical protein
MEKDIIDLMEVIRQLEGGSMAMHMEGTHIHNALRVANKLESLIDKCAEVRKGLDGGEGS